MSHVQNVPALVSSYYILLYLTQYYILLYMKGAEKFVCKKKNLYPYYLIHGKVFTDSGKVEYTTIRLCTYEHYCRTHE